MSTSTTSVLFAFLSIWSLLGLGLTLRMNASPNPWNQMLNTDLDVSCILDGQDASSHDIVAIQIERPNKKPIVVLDAKHGLDMGPEATSNIEGEGHIDSGNGRSFVKITIREPGSQDMGIYECSMFYRDLAFQFKEERKTINVTLDNGNSQSATSFLSAKLSALEKVVHQQATQIALVTEENKKQLSEISQLKAANEIKISGFDSELNQLKTSCGKRDNDLDLLKSRFVGLNRTIEDQDKRLNLLQSSGRIDSHIAFSMRYKDTDKLIRGQAMKFSEQLLMMGTGYYNPSDGVFTAPLRGVYVFHLVVLTWINSDAIGIQIRLNDNTMAKLWAYDGNSDEMASQSVILKLEQGDKVVPHLYYVLGSDRANDLNSVFSGYLLYSL